MQKSNKCKTDYLNKASQTADKRPIKSHSEMCHYLSIPIYHNKKEKEKNTFESYFLWVHHTLAHNICEFYSIHLKWFLTHRQQVKDCEEFKWSPGMQDFSRDSFQTASEVYFPLGIVHKKKLDLMTTYFSKEDRLIHVVKSIDSHILKRAGTVLHRNSIWDRPNDGSTTNFSSSKPSRTRSRRIVFCWRGPEPTDIFSMSNFFSFIPACPPVIFLAQEGADPTELLPIILHKQWETTRLRRALSSWPCTPAAAARGDVLHPRVLAMLPLGQMGTGLKTLWSPQIFKVLFFVHSLVLSTLLPNHLSSSTPPWLFPF